MFAYPDDAALAGALSRLAREELRHFEQVQRVMQTLGVRHDPKHAWYYLSSMTKEDVALIKCYDSKPGAAVYTPHTAFVLEPSEPYVPRASVEVRALLIGG